MILYYVCVKDRTIDSFAPPFAMEALQTAKREFADLCNLEDTPIGKHPDDYDLYYVGTFNTDDGVFTNVEHINPICKGRDCVFNKPKA